MLASPENGVPDVAAGALVCEAKAYQHLHSLLGHNLAWQQRCVLKISHSHHPGPQLCSCVVEAHSLTQKNLSRSSSSVALLSHLVLWRSNPPAGPSH